MKCEVRTKVDSIRDVSGGKQTDEKMLNSSPACNRSKAFTAEFNILAPKDQAVKLTYKVGMSY
ncbi:MAG: hypothetical protein M0R70_09965 [Nitrospirae bacterium]|nr:hypothetical protein [Nitrospirota bacterium]